MEAVREQLQKVFREVFKDPDLIIQDNMTSSTLPGRLPTL